MTGAGHEATRSAIEAVWRIESPRLIAGLARMTGDVGAAEELAQDALVIALEQWPAQGVPDGPGGWLLASVLEVIYLVFNEGYAATAGGTGCGRRCAPRRCGSAGCWPG